MMHHQTKKKRNRRTKKVRTRGKCSVDNEKKGSAKISNTPEIHQCPTDKSVHEACQDVPHTACLTATGRAEMRPDSKMSQIPSNRRSTRNLLSVCQASGCIYTSSSFLFCLTRGSSETSNKNMNLTMWLSVEFLFHPHFLPSTRQWLHWSRDIKAFTHMLPPDVIPTFHPVSHQLIIAAPASYHKNKYMQQKKKIYILYIYWSWASWVVM